MTRQARLHAAAVAVSLSLAGASHAATDAPCMAVLARFSAMSVPTTGPAETFAPAGDWTAGVTPADLPGKGVAQHPMLYAGENYNKLFVVNDGKVLWTYSTGPGYEYDDVWMLSNGDVLFSRMQYVAIVSPDKQVVWRYDAENTPGPTRTEIHGCQPIGADRVLFVVNGLPPRAMIVNTKTGAVEVNHELPMQQPPSEKNIHGQFRRIRYTAAGTFLVPFLTMNQVVEYDKEFKEIWRYDIRSPWAAIRLKNGNTLITDEAESLTREVNAKGETIWEFKTSDLPAEYRFASAPQSCTRLANGNTIFTSRGGKGGTGPQLVEVTRDKQVVWVLQDWQTLGPASAVQVLDEPGVPEEPGQSEH